MKYKCLMWMSLVYDIHLYLSDQKNRVWDTIMAIRVTYFTNVDASLAFIISSVANGQAQLVLDVRSIQVHFLQTNTQTQTAADFSSTTRSRSSHTSFITVMNVWTGYRGWVLAFLLPKWELMHRLADGQITVCHLSKAVISVIQALDTTPERARRG